MRLISAVLLLATSTCAFALVPPPAHLSIFVKDESGAAVQRATVALKSEETGVAIVGQTDQGGNFEVDLKAGRYRILLSANWFKTLSSKIELKNGDAEHDNFTMVVGRSGSVNVESPIIPQIEAHLTSVLADEESKPIEIKVVVLSMFERGEDTGDIPGEFQFWVEREHLDTILPNPAGYHHLRLNAEKGILGMVTGMGTAHAAASVMALGLDPRFDLTHAYILVAGIGGIDPARGSVGSAVWSDYIVDGDLAYEIDPREIPSTWTTGYIPLGKAVPYEQPRMERTPGDDGTVYKLNSALVSWAFALTKDTPLKDNPGITEFRSKYMPNDPTSPAHKPPFVLRGDNLSASTYWHGKLMNKWAEDWVKYQTEGKGTYTICGMEDTGTMQSLTYLGKAHKIDIDRVLILRTASNYDQQPPDKTAAESLRGEKIAKYSAYIPALEAAYGVGHVIVDKLVADWPQTRDHIPTK